jgi:hypothetical protein
VVEEKNHSPLKLNLLNLLNIKKKKVKNKNKKVDEEENLGFTPLINK